MALITGSGGDYSENYSRRGNASRYSEDKAQDLVEQFKAGLLSVGQ